MHSVSLPTSCIAGKQKFQQGPQWFPVGAALRQQVLTWQKNQPRGAGMAEGLLMWQ